MFELETCIYIKLNNIKPTNKIGNVQHYIAFFQHIKQTSKNYYEQPFKILTVNIDAYTIMP